MTKIFFHDNGDASRNPTSKQQAVELRRLQYDDRQLCPNCRDCSVKFTHNDRCKHCARMAAGAFYNNILRSLNPQSDKIPPWPEDVPVTDEMREGFDASPLADYIGHFTNPQQAAEAGAPVWIRDSPCSKAGHPGVRLISGECWYCDRERKRNAARAEARKAGATWYTPADPCPNCGTTAQRRVVDNRCSQCQPVRSAIMTPRQAALQAGEKWYTPTDPCPRCHTAARRRVDNGQCAGCQPTNQHQEQTTNQQIMEACPDMVISRDDARTAGMGIYRTGRPCKRGHSGWRYVKGGACIDCHNERG